MITTTRRVTFNLQGFIEELQTCLLWEDRHEDIDDVVQTYKDFLKRTDEGLVVKVKSYVDNHPVVMGDSNLKSFISACYK